MYKPPIVSIDFESTDLLYWNPNFRALSCAFAWRGPEGELKTKMIEGEAEVGKFLKRIADDNIPVVVHNVAFEYGVMRYRYPDIELEYVDTARLGQVYDNLGDENDPSHGSGLVKTCSRILPDYTDHKAEAYNYLRSIGVKKGEEGANLDKLPADIMERYNVADAVWTLKLYEHITAEFAEIDYDWTLDHTLYTYMAKGISLAQARGTLVDREKLQHSIKALRAEIRAIDEGFREHFRAEIEVIEQARKEAWINGPKTEKGRQKRAEQVEDKRDQWGFKISSTKDLKVLFVDVLGIEPTFRSPKGAPSFKASHLHTYGEGGKLLANRNKRRLVLKQCENLLALSETGRWHMNIKPTGTATGRLAGGRISE